MRSESEAVVMVQLDADRILVTAAPKDKPRWVARVSDR